LIANKKIGAERVTAVISQRIPSAGLISNYQPGFRINELLARKNRVRHFMHVAYPAHGLSRVVHLNATASNCNKRTCPKQHIHGVVTVVFHRKNSCSGMTGNINGDNQLIFRDLDIY
jgi:hypothetical protein